MSRHGRRIGRGTKCTAQSTKAKWKKQMPNRGQVDMSQQQAIETCSKLDLRTKRGRQAFIDAHYERAVEVIRTANRASVATLQRNMGIRYIDAVRLIDELERRSRVLNLKPIDDTNKKE